MILRKAEVLCPLDPCEFNTVMVIAKILREEEKDFLMERTEIISPKLLKRFHPRKLSKRNKIR